MASIVLAVALAVVAVGPCLPTRLARAALVLAIVLAVVIWLAEGLGGLFTGGGTDPNSGPLLALLAVAFWPAAPSSAAPTPPYSVPPLPHRKEPDMGGPAWLTDIFAGVMITVAAYCASRLVVARWWRRPTDVDSDGMHVVMGVAMAGMLVTGLRFGPVGLWEAVFAAAACWFGWRFMRVRRGAAAEPVALSAAGPAPGRVRRDALHVPRAAGGGRRGQGRRWAGWARSGARFSVLALALALFMFGYVVRVSDRLTAHAPALAVAVAGAVPAANPPEAPGALMTATGPESAKTASPGGCAGAAPRCHASSYLAPRCAAMCKIAMGITMGYMLILML